MGDVYTQPVGLQEWMMARLDTINGGSYDEARTRAARGGDPVARDGGTEQAMLIRDAFHPLLENRYDDRKENPPWVVGEHHSKSVLLPVVHFHTSHGLEVWMRCNFYNWKFSVRSKRPIPDIFQRLFNRDEDINPVYCEGFASQWVFGPYSNNQQEFTVEVPGSIMYPEFRSGMGFTFCFLLGEAAQR